jgi:predicted dehydrogenase
MKIGIIGAGHIAEVVAPTLVAMEGIECYAVSSRSLEKAQKFAKAFGFEKAYGSYDDDLRRDFTQQGQLDIEKYCIDNVVHQIRNILL